MKLPVLWLSQLAQTIGRRGGGGKLPGSPGWFPG